jgi:hypothetical protein
VVLISLEAVLLGGAFWPSPSSSRKDVVMNTENMPSPTEFNAVLSEFERNLREILAHGFGTCTATVETLSGGKTVIRVEAAKSQQYIVVPRGSSSGRGAE